MYIAFMKDIRMFRDVSEIPDITKTTECIYWKPATPTQLNGGTDAGRPQECRDQNAKRKITVEDTRQKIWILVGLLGSGKSFWSRQMSHNNDKIIVVNKDDFRSMIRGGKYTWSQLYEPFLQS